MLHVISTLVLFILAAGIYFRRQRPDLHVKAMGTAFVIDIALVLYIELTRQAVESVVTQVKPLTWFHAAISLSVVVLYVVQIVLGRRLLAARAAGLATSAGSIGTGDNGNTRNLHRNLGITFCVFRILNYVTAFMI
jgi:uncharacterized membrane protein YozB (DUF420 family)